MRSDETKAQPYTALDGIVPTVLPFLCRARTSGTTGCAADARGPRCRGLDLVVDEMVVERLFVSLIPLSLYL